jgi:hypothetical protein
MNWPEPGTLPTIARAEIPIGARILGMAPMGVRWEAVMTKKGIRPDGNCPPGEFVPCFTETTAGIREIA